MGSLMKMKHMWYLRVETCRFSRPMLNMGKVDYHMKNLVEADDTAQKVCVLALLVLEF